MSIQTTTIGAYPKPQSTPVPDWFNDGMATYGGNPTAEWVAAMSELGENALDFGFENIDRAFYKCPRYVTRTVHMCCSYPDRLDNPNYLKGPPDAYAHLIDAIEDSSIMAVSIEDAHDHLELNILERLGTTKLILGVVAIGKSRVESVEEIQDRLNAALLHIDADRLLASPDCGLGLLGCELTLQKLNNMSAAAHTLGV